MQGVGARPCPLRERRSSSCSLAVDTPAKARGCKDVTDEVIIDVTFIGKDTLANAKTVVKKDGQKVNEAS